MRSSYNNRLLIKFFFTIAFSFSFLFFPTSNVSATINACLGQPITLNYSSSNVGSCQAVSAPPGYPTMIPNANNNGIFTITPGNAGTFSLTCDGVTSSDTLTVDTSKTWNGSSCVAAAGPTGTITADPCTVPTGQSSCQTPFNWTSSNASNVTVASCGYTGGGYTGSCSVTVFGQQSGASGGVWGTITPNGAYAELRNNGGGFSSVTVAAVCQSGSTWNGSTCAAQAPNTPTISSYLDAYNITVGQTSTLTWTTTYATKVDVWCDGATPTGARNAWEQFDLPANGNKAVTSNSGMIGTSSCHIRPYGAGGYGPTQNFTWNVAQAGQTCPNGYNLVNGSCVLPVPTGLSASCSGSQATFSWTAPPGWNTFYTRISSGGVNLTSSGAWDDNMVGTSKTFSTTPGTSYSYWIHTRDPANGNYSVSVDGGFTCPAAQAPNTPTISSYLDAYNITVGQTSTLTWTTTYATKVDVWCDGATPTGARNAWEQFDLPANGNKAVTSNSGMIGTSSCHIRPYGAGGYGPTQNFTWNVAAAAITSCPTGQYLSGGACYTIPTVSNFSATCNSSGTSATFTWTAPAGFNTFFTRASNSSGLMGAPGTDDSFVGTSKTFTTVPGQTYNVWVHTRDTSVNPTWNYSSDIGAGFTCPVPQAQPTGSISAPSCTVPAGGSSCATTFTWSTTNATNPSAGACTNSCSVSLFERTGASGTQSANISPNNSYAEVRSNGTALNSMNVAAICASGSNWNGSTCACPSGQTAQNGSCVTSACSNGTTNYPSCNACPAGYSLQGGYCNPNPFGSADSASCSVATGWTCDPGNFNQQISVHVYEGGTYIGQTVANVGREAAVGQLCGNGTSAHGYQFIIPDSFKNGSSRTLTSYGINIGTGDNVWLGNVNTPSGCYPPPTANFTVNGSHNVILTEGQANTKTWSSTNGTSWSSTYYVTQDPGSNFTCSQNGASGAWGANSASGSSSGNAQSAYMGCIVTITYTVSNSSGSASDTIYITGLASQSASITAPACTVPAGGSSCATTFTWYTSNLPNVSAGACTNSCSVSLFEATGASGSRTVNITPVVSTGIVRSNGSGQSAVSVTAVCASGSSWNGSTCTCPSGQEAYNGSCQAVPPPTNITGSCNLNGTTGTFSWTPPAGHNTFYTRAYVDGAYIYPATDDNFVGTSKSFPTTPGKYYDVWVHTRDPATGSASTHIATSFTCTNNAPTISVSPTNTGMNLGSTIYLTLTSQDNAPDMTQDAITWSTPGVSGWNWQNGFVGGTFNANSGATSNGYASFAATANRTTIYSATPDRAGVYSYYGSVLDNGSSRWTSTPIYTITVCGTGSSWNGSSCVVTSCSNGATNPPSCTNCPLGQSMQNGACSANPFGNYDSISCSVVSGWTCDPSDYSQQIGVHFYEGSTFIGQTVANVGREPGVGQACGNGMNAHGFSYTIPDSFKNGTARNVTAYPINIGTGSNINLGTQAMPTGCYAPASSTITAPACTVPAGGSSCATTFTWYTSNLPNVSAGACTNSCSVSLFEATGASGSRTVNITPVVSTGIVRSNGSGQSAVSVTAVCASGSSWNGSTCTCPSGQEASGGTCQVIPAPTNIVASCNASGTSATFSWTAPAGHNNFAPRAYNGTDSVYLYPPTSENFVGTSKTFATTPGKAYGVWVHTQDPVTGNYSAAISANFTCSNNAPTISVSPTNTGMNLGNTTNFTVTSADNAPDITMDTLNWTTPGLTGWNWENGNNGAGATVTPNANPYANGYSLFPATQNRTTIYTFTPDRAGTYTYYTAALDNGGSRWTSTPIYTITVCGTGSSWNGSSCVVTSCSNGATNPPSCTTCPAGKELSGGTCQVIPAPTNPVAACSIDATSATFSWTAPAGHATFYTRASVGGVMLGAPATDDNFVGTSKTFATTPGSTYVWWVQTKDPATGNWSTDTGGTFTCTAPPTVTSAVVNVNDCVNPNISLSCSNADGYRVQNADTGTTVAQASGVSGIVPITDEGNYSISCLRGGTPGPSVLRSYSSVSCTPRDLSFIASPRTIKQGSSATLTWGLTYPNNSCSLSAKAVCPNNATSCPGPRENAAAVINSTLTSTNTDANDPNGARAIQSTVKTKLSGSKRGAGKKTLLINYTTDFILRCTGVPDIKTRIQVSTENEG